MPGNNNNGPSADKKSVAFMLESDCAPPSVNSGSFDQSVFELEFYKDLNTAPDIAVFCQRISAIVNRLGFSDYSFSRPFSHCEATTEFLTVAKEIVDCYCAEDFFPHDIIVHYARDNDLPIFQSTIEQYLAQAPFTIKTFRRSRDLYRMLRRFGYFDYYFVPTIARAKDGNTKDRGLFAVTLKDSSPSELQNRVGKNKSILCLLADAIADIGALRFPEFFTDPAVTEEIRITPKPLRLLAALAQEDVTLNEAADRLCISVHTANQHVAAARKAFGAKTTTGAVYQALKSKLIKL